MKNHQKLGQLTIQKSSCLDCVESIIRVEFLLTNCKFFSCIILDVKLLIVPEKIRVCNRDNMLNFTFSLLLLFSDDSDWNMTVKGSSSTPYIEQLNDNEPTLDNLRIEVNVQQNNVNNGVSVSAFEERLSTTTTTTSSPVKETRRSPSKDQKSIAQQQPLVKEVSNQQHRRSTSPQKESAPSRPLAHTGGVAKSDLNIVSCSDDIVLVD